MFNKYSTIFEFFIYDLTIFTIKDLWSSSPKIKFILEKYFFKCCCNNNILCEIYQLFLSFSNTINAL